MPHNVVLGSPFLARIIQPNDPTKYVSHLHEEFIIQDD